MSKPDLALSRYVFWVPFSLLEACCFGGEQEAPAFVDDDTSSILKPGRFLDLRGLLRLGLVADLDTPPTLAPRLESPSVPLIVCSLAPNLESCACLRDRSPPSVVLFAKIGQALHMPGPFLRQNRLLHQSVQGRPCVCPGKSAVLFL